MNSCILWGSYPAWGGLIDCHCDSTPGESLHKPFLGHWYFPSTFLLSPGAIISLIYVKSSILEPAIMGEYISNPSLSTLPEEFDIIVCGGGSCGCVVAGR